MEMTEKKYELFKESQNDKLYRIRALRDFEDVVKGDVGGFVEGEHNLSHEGSCWIYGNARVCDNARVSDNACVCDDAKVYGKAHIYGYAWITGWSDVYDDAKVCGSARVYGNVYISGDAYVHGSVSVYGYADIGGNADVSSNGDYIVFKNWWSSGRYFTWTRSNNMYRVGCFYGTGKELIEKAYKDSELSGREYERIVRYVEQVMNDNK